MSSRRGELAPSDTLLHRLPHLPAHPSVKPIALPTTLKGKLALDLDLASGYEWVDVRDEGDEGESSACPFPDGSRPRARGELTVLTRPTSLSRARMPETLPPLSIYTPPSSYPSLIQLLPLSLSQPPPPPTEAGAGPSSSSSSSGSSVLADTAILIVLDWTKPGTMVDQLLGWLEWVDEWAEGVAGRGESEEIRERRQSARARSTTD